MELLNGHRPVALRSRLACLVLLSCLSGTGVAQIPERINLLAAARYSDLERLVEKEVRLDPQPASYKLVYLCLAYGNLKKYAKLFRCLDELEKNVRRGDTAFTNLGETPGLGLLGLVGSIFAGSEGMKGDVTPFLHLMRSEAYTELRDHDKAIAAAKQAETAVPRGGSQERGIRIKALTALGLSHAFAGKRSEAEKYAESLSALSTAFPYVGLADDKVTGLARIHIALGNFKKAYEGLRSDSSGIFAPLLAFGDAFGGALVGMEAESTFTYQKLPKQYMAARTLLEVGEIKRAKEGYDKLLQVRQVADNGEIYWLLLFDRGRIAAGEGDIEGAINFWKRAIEVIEQQRSSINTEANKIGFVGDKQAVYGRLVALLLQQGRVAEGFGYVERSKSRALVDMLASKKEFIAPGADADKVKQVLAQLDAAELDSLAQDAAAGTRTRGMDSARQEIRQTAPELSTLVAVGTVGVEELARLIGEGEMLVEYYYQGGDLYAFLASRTQLQAVKLGATDLDERVRLLRSAIGEYHSNLWESRSQVLYEQLWKPIETFVTGKSVIVVPHGVLHYLPFAALRRADGGLLIDAYEFRFLPAASVLKFLRPPLQKKDMPLLALGNPDLGDPKFDLQFAEAEARDVALQFPESRVLVRKAASKSNFRDLAAAFPRIHFATHGKFEADHPLESGLYLARDAGDDGLLSVGLLYSMALDADLVTLSACDTGLGGIANGDDVVGLTRGFLYAGSRSIVATLWSVDDRATSELMKAFYGNFKTFNKREALRQAQLKVRQDFSHPFFWAAFQLTGQAD